MVLRRLDEAALGELLARAEFKGDGSIDADITRKALRALRVDWKISAGSE